MKHILLAACVLLTGTLAFGQDQKIINDKNAQKRTAQGFHGIHIASGIDLYLTQSNEEAVAVSASDPDYRDRIVTEVEGGILHIYLDTRSWHWNWGNHKMKAYVSCKVLDELTASGGSDVYIEEPIHTEALHIHLSGGSDLNGKATVTGELSIEQSGGADAYLGGSAAQLHVHVSGGSDFHGYDFTVDNCRAEASGGSDIYITVNKELDAEASGGSDIHYKGSGSVHSSHASGSGSISRRD